MNDSRNLSQFCDPTVDRLALLVSDRVGNVQQHLQLGPLLDQFWVR